MYHRFALCSTCGGRVLCLSLVFVFFFQAEDGIRDLVRSRGLGDVYKRQVEQRLGDGLVRLARAAPMQPEAGDRADERGIIGLSLIHI